MSQRPSEHFLCTFVSRGMTTFHRISDLQQANQALVEAVQLQKEEYAPYLFRSLTTDPQGKASQAQGRFSG